MSGDGTENAENAEYAGERLRARLAQDPRTAELEVRVSIVGRKVFLDGTVPTPERRDAIAAVARETLPDHEVHAHIALAELRPAEDAEELT